MSYSCLFDCRYLGITRPLTYPARQNGQLMAKMIFGVWLVSASITLPPFCGWAKNVNTAGICLISQDISYTIYSTAVAFYIPMIVMLFMYYKIFKAARKSGAKHRFTDFSRRERLETVASEALRMQGLKPQHTPGVAEECAALSRLLSRKRQNISIFKREQKAATTLGVIVGVFGTCWLPFFILSTARPFICGINCSCIPIWLERMLLWFGYANSLMNPFIYAFFNRDLRSTYRDLLRCRYRNINRRMSAVGVHEALRVWKDVVWSGFGLHTVQTGLNHSQSRMNNVHCSIHLWDFCRESMNKRQNRRFILIQNTHISGSLRYLVSNCCIICTCILHYTWFQWALKKIQLIF